MIWCDGECIASSDERCCETRCFGEVNVNNGTGSHYCGGPCTSTERTPGCCDYQTQVWCDGLEWIPTVPPSHHYLTTIGPRNFGCENNGGRCIDKGTEGEVLCASTCIVVTSDEGTKSLECSSDTSRAHRICPDLDACECPGKAITCATSPVRAIRRNPWGAWRFTR